ncbi:protein kinase, putative [Leishmania donovani]|uniref:Protein kinase, putative n=1 Tax=Leishmania donovani TaxID=5661 RepID=A0A3S7WT68_LEIDO|nr:protein kinase, putative [Leishmania donovani]
MSAPYPSSPSLSPSVGTKRVIASPRTAHDLTMRLGNDGLHGSRSGMASPLTELLASSPSRLQPLSTDVGLSPSNWAGRGSGGAGSLLQPAREQARVPAAPDITPAAPSRHTRRGSSLGCSSPPQAPLQREGGSLATDGAFDSQPPSSGERNTFLTVPQSNTGKGVPPPKRGIPLLSGALSTPSSSSQTFPRTSVPAALNSGGTRDDSVLVQQTLTKLSTNAVTGDRVQRECDASPAGRTVHESPLGTTGGASGAGSASPSTGVAGTASRTLETYALPNALVVGGGSSNCTTPHSLSTTMVSPHGRSTFAASILTTGTQLTTGNGTASTGGSAGLGANHNGACAFTPSSLSQDGNGGQSRAPRLASHLFLEDGSIPDISLPPATLQSPAVPDGQQHFGCSGGGGHVSVTALDQSRTPLCSAERRASLCDESSALAAVSLPADASRPTAANFVKGELIGKGSYGAVYRGMQRNNNRIIAMKEIRLPGVVEQQLRQPEKLAATAASPAGVSSCPVLPASNSVKGESALAKEVAAIKRELTLLKQLNHPNIVRYLNDEVVDGTLRIYMDYVSGGSVTAALKSYGSFEEPQAAALCFQLLQGLAYMHRRGIIHRDLKGDNLLLETSSQLKIADLGTARSICSSTMMTTNIVGTAYFMAPEVLQPNGAAVGTAADIWSVACCVIEMMTGKPPLSDLPNQFTVMMAIGGSATVPLDKYIPADNTWSSEVLDFISQCLRANPAQRPTAVELLQHSWFAKFLNVVHVPSMSTPATLNSFLTPPAPPIERPFTLSPQRQMVSPICSPNLTAVLTPGYAGPQYSAGQPESRSSSRTSSRTSRERKGKRDKRVSARRHTRYSTSGATSATSRRSQESSQASTPQYSSSTRTRDGSAQSASLPRSHSHPGRQQGPTSKRRAHAHTPGHGLLKDDSRQSSSSEYAMPHHTCTPASGSAGAGGGGDGSGDKKTKTAFLPAITHNGSVALSPCGYSLDMLRCSRSLKNSGSSREPVKACLHTTDAENKSRDLLHLGQCLSDHHQSFSRDLVDSSMQHGGVTKAGVESGLSTRGAGSHSMIDDLEGMSQRTLPPSISALPSTSCKNTRASEGAS